MNGPDAMRKWFSAWLKRDGACIDEIFSEDVCYTECYGPEYIGRAQVKRWFADWNAYAASRNFSRAARTYTHMENTG